MDEDVGPAGFDPRNPGFELVLEIEIDDLVANVTGRIDGIEAVIAMFMRLAAELRRTGLRRLLVIDHTFGVVPTEDQLQLVANSVSGQGYADARVAYVDARGTAISRMEVGEIIGREHGYECRVFDSESRARIWLHYGE